MTVVIQEVTNTKQRDLFIKFPWQVYGANKNWVPPLRAERRDFLDPLKNPFFKHAMVKLFIAQGSGGTMVGRIASIVDFDHLAAHRDKTGFFGLWESVDCQEVSNSLFDAAAALLRSHQLDNMRGPMNMSINHEVGLLTTGFDSPPAIMMPYNPPYYERLIEGYGFHKVMDLGAYHAEIRTGLIPDRVTRVAQLAQQRYNFRIRGLDMDAFDRESRMIHKVYTTAWEKNWGAVPMTTEEFVHLALQLRQIIDPELCLIAESGSETIGFSLAIPDFNQALRYLNGRLFPVGVFKLLWYRRRINTLRVITMGVLKQYRNRGVDTCMYYETFKRSLAKGYYQAEMSWILENNVPMNRALKKLGCSLYKRYRLYDYKL